MYTSNARNVSSEEMHFSSTDKIHGHNHFSFVNNDLLIIFIFKNNI